MAPTLKSTEAEGSASEQHQQSRMEMDISRTNEGVPRHNAVTTPVNSQTQRVDGSSSLATTHQTNEDARTELATAAAEQHENQATVTTWWSPLVSPLSRLVGAITQPRHIPVNQSQQYESLLNLMNTMRAEILEQGRAVKDYKAEINAKLQEYQRDQKKEYRRNRVKQEKAAGKPTRVKSEYNFHVKEVSKRLKAEGSDKNVIEYSAMTWKMTSVQARSRLYSDMVAQDRERYEREMKLYESRRYADPAEDRKPAADPTPEELAATAEDGRKPAAEPTPEELAAIAAADHPQEPSQLNHEEPVAAVAVEGLGGSDGGYQPSEYEQQRERNIARNEERLRSLGLQSESICAVKARKSSKKRKKRNNALETPSRRSPRKPRHNLLVDSSGAAALQCPVGYEFTHFVPPSIYHDGYACVAEVVRVEGECEYYEVFTLCFVSPLSFLTI